MRVFSILGTAFSFAIIFYCALSIYSSFKIHIFCYSLTTSLLYSSTFPVIAIFTMVRFSL